ncbi:MAG: peptide chain release factor 3 [Thermoleophilia bacterium]
MTAAAVPGEAARRRTFAIISHPDAGKTTLTEKLLLYGGAIEMAGAVKARRGHRSTASDWMAIEQQRGISVSSTVMRFEYRDTVLNLLDTPGHRDFSEDTYRVLTACDAAVMVLDAAKGIEDQTRKLLAVCLKRGVPVISFANKVDRPGLEPLELLDQIETEMGMTAAPMTWPVSADGAFAGLYWREQDAFIGFTRSARGATEAEEHVVPWADAPLDAAARRHADDERDLLDVAGAEMDAQAFRAGRLTPVFFGSALANFGVRHVLDALVDLAPPPGPWATAGGEERAVTDSFSGFVFKMQANSDPAHRDRIAYVRVCSGCFERGQTLTLARSGKQLTTRHAHLPFGRERHALEEAYPGDVIALVNAAELRIGDTVFADSAVEYPPIPVFAPEQFASARNMDSSRHKQFRRGLEQLDQEGVVQVLHRRARQDPVPVLAAVGPLQFEVALHRLREEFRASVELDPPRTGVVRLVEPGDVQAIERAAVQTLERSDGRVLALFDTQIQLNFFEQRHPELTLTPLTAGDVPAAAT